MSKASDVGRQTSEGQLFRDAMHDVQPIRASARVVHDRPKPKPHPAVRDDDERDVLAELARAGFDDDAEFEDEGLYLRPGLPRDILRKLRRTHWAIQASLDLHGLTGDEAVAHATVFLVACRREGIRCVRLIHGKGLRTPGREPVLKRRIRKLLTRRDDVLAFVEPRAIHGGGGAVVALLEA